MTTLRPRSKIWLELDGEPFLGDCRARLLRLIDQTGSIQAAARMMDLSYRKAWTLLQVMERRSPWPLVRRHAGGAAGGHSQLTAEARLLLAQFESIGAGINDLVDERFRLLFEPAKGKGTLPC